MKHIQDLNLTIYLKDDRKGSELDSAMFQADKNICELVNEGECVTDYGIYFGTSDSHEPKFCPRHYFTGGGYVIEPIEENK